MLAAISAVAQGAAAFMIASTPPGTAKTPPHSEVLPANATNFTSVGCPFCALLCDDLALQRAPGGTIKVTANGCPKALAGFERVRSAAGPMIEGKRVSLAEAITVATALIAQARAPLYGGCATDVEGMRAILAIADRTGGVVDHALSDALYRNFRVLQSTGWVTTTLTEVRNRADLVIIVGSDFQKSHPRFFERCIANTQSMFAEAPAKRTVVFIGDGLDQSGARGAGIGEVVTLACPKDRVGDVISALRARLKGAPVHGTQVANVPLAAIDDLARRCHAASYGVIAWSPRSLAFPDADLTVQAICDTVRDLNVSQRFAGLSVGGDEGGVTAGAVASWQTGYPLRVSFAGGKPTYDPARYAVSAMLKAGEGDLLVWTAAITPDIAVPQTDLPTIVLGTPGLVMPKTPHVYIPVGTPGLDQAGRMIRCDSVVTIPLRSLGASTLPSVAHVVGAIEAALQI